MFLEENKEKIIDGLVPVAVAMGTYLIVSLGFDVVIEMKFHPEKMTDPIFVFICFSFIIFIYLLCLYYGKNKLGYFSDQAKFIKHLLLLIILPASIAGYDGFNSFQAKSISIQQNQKN